MYTYVSEGIRGVSRGSREILEESRQSEVPGDALGIQGILLGSGGHCKYPEVPVIRVFLSIDGDPFFKILVPSLYITSTMYCSPRLCMFTLN